ncbi:MAG: alpha-hydroxy-acid oxidizing enzyme [Promethearchaeota archaeon Loki_b32]|nr:MAG: alpha-hydroxy-acid oxidizing enzyme [Candidatus Lokiarchaeota archaeon Loki_b32]
MTTEVKTLEDVRNIAREKLKGICGVYKDCDGDPRRLCQGQGYGRSLGIGGIGSGASFNNNFLALRKYNLKMKLINKDFTSDTKYNFFGKELSMPIMAASVAGVNSFGGDKVITEEEFCRSVVLGCRDAETIGWRGDTYTYSFENSYGLNAIAEAGGWGVKIVKPRDQGTIMKFFNKAEEVRCVSVGIDVDGCGSYAMAMHNKPVFKKSIEEIKELISSTNLPVIIKGIMCVEDALIAKEAGAAAIVVSNHGGRVLDHTPGTAEVLSRIVEETKGKIKIIVDGGIRTGYDVLKMLALGAESVLIGRDIIRASVGAGIKGVQIHMEYMQKTLAKAMKMTNCKSLEEVTSDILV